MPAPRLTPLAAAVLHVGSPERILMVGCGEGEPALFLAREFPAARVRGLDRSADAVRRATARTGLDPEGRIAFRAGTPRSLPFPDDHFGLLAFLDVGPAPREAARVLRSGGFLVLADSQQAKENLRIFPPLLGRKRMRKLFEPVWEEAAGDGSFSVARLRAPGRATPAD